MDYIYKNSLGDKHIGEIKFIESVPYYAFLIKLGRKNIWCHLDHILNEWHIHFIEQGKNIELAHPRDVLWNSEALLEICNEEEAYKIAYGIRMVYDQFN